MDHQEVKMKTGEVYQPASSTPNYTKVVHTTEEHIFTAPYQKNYKTS